MTSKLVKKADLAKRPSPPPVKDALPPDDLLHRAQRLDLRGIATGYDDAKQGRAVGIGWMMGAGRNRSWT
jgi:hypothetical protein